jgi:hypothetical protein
MPAISVPKPRRAAIRHAALVVDVGQIARARVRARLISMRRPGALALIAALATLACAPGASARVPNACTLLTRSEASALLGGKLEFKVGHGTTGLYSDCTWNGVAYANAAMGQHPTVSLTVGQTTRRTFQRRIARGRPVRGVGELAYYESAELEALYVFDHGYSLLLSVPGDDGGLARAKTAARQIIVHLR